MTDTSLDASSPGRPVFRFRDVFSKSFRVFGQGTWAFMIVMAIANLPALLTTLSGADLDLKTRAETLLGADTFTIIGASYLFGIFVIAAISQAIVIEMAFETLQRKTLDMRRAVRAAAARAIPLVGTFLYVYILLGLCLVVQPLAGTGPYGSLVRLLAFLLVIPSLIVFLVGLLALQVCAIEQVGPVAAFKRSAFLTRGHRWQIVGMLTLTGLVGEGAKMILTHGLTSALGPKIAILVAYPVTVVYASFGVILCTVIYHDLRSAKEGLEPDRLATVFE